MSSQVRRHNSSQADTQEGAEMAADSAQLPVETAAAPAFALATETTPNSDLNLDRPQLKVIPGGILGERTPFELQTRQTDIVAEAPGLITADQAEKTTSATATSAKTAAVAEPRLTSAGIRINLEFFNGPMDLFLHLVQQQEVDIANVSMKVVAEQYLEVVSDLINQLEAGTMGVLGYDLEQVSEYLVIAATLTALKSSAILPSSSTEGLHEELDNHSEQFLEELRERLKAYEHTKRRAAELTRLPQLGIDTFVRNDRKAMLPTPEMLSEPDDPRTLGEHLSRLMKRIGALGEVFRIQLEPVSIVSSMMKVVDFLSAAPAKFASGEIQPLRSFRDLLRSLAGDRQIKNVDGARTVVIGGFIAVLELVKRGVLNVSQTDDAADIRLSLAGDSQAPQMNAPFTSEFDENPELQEVNGVS